MKVNIPDALRKRIADTRASKPLAEAGRLLVEQGIVRVAGFPDAHVDLLSDWAADPFGNRSWQWSNAAFNFIPSLVAAHAQGCTAAIGYALDALASWRRAVNGPLRDYEFANHDHATARQAENLVLLLAYMVEVGVDPDACRDVEAAILAHGALLEREDFYSRHTNHGIEQSRILAMVGDFLPERARARAWRELAMGRLGAELGHGFTREGVHVENSPGYHAYVALSFLKIRDYFSDESLGALAAGIDALMPKAIRFLMHVARPDGRYPLIGDTHGTRIVNHFRRYAKTREYAQLRYVLSDGAFGTMPRETSMLFPVAGYFVARDAWQPPSHAKDAFHLVFRCGFRSRYHRQDDDLSLVLYCLGEDWLIDSGAYNYAEQDPIRRYMRSKWAHNVPVMVQAKARRWQQEWPPMSLPMQRANSSSGHATVRAVSHSYPDHVAIRDLELAPAQRCFTVRDALIQAAPLGNRRYLSLWHLPSDKQVSVHGQAVEVFSPATGNRLLIENLGRPARSIGLVDPGIDGVAGPVVSWAANAAEPAQLLAFEWGGQQLQSELRFQVLPAGATP